MEVSIDIEFFTIIAGRNLKEDLCVAVSKQGGRLQNIMYGHGTVTASYVMDAFGFVPEEHKVIITCLLPPKRAVELMRVLVEEFDFNKPNTGIAFSVSLDKMSF